MRKWGFKSRLSVFAIRSTLGWSGAVLFGAGGLLAGRLFNLSKLPAAGLTLGLFGFAGGSALARLLQAVGGRLQPWQHSVLAVTWALCCMGGVLPLFYTIGTRLEMTVRMFYSFAIFGAVGGLITTLVLRASFLRHAKNDLIPSTVTWAFSLGLAAVALDAAGDWLPALFPAVLAWPIAIGVMIALLGFGSGYSILQFFQSKPKAGRGLLIPKQDDESSAVGQRATSVWTLILLCAPFYLNDFSNIFVTNWRWWLLIDYTGVKLFPCLVILHLIRRHTLRWVDLIGSERPSAVSFISVIVIAVLAAMFIEQNGSLILKKLFRDIPLSSIPDIPDPLWRWIDLSTGLLMVGIFEELIFRGYLHTFLSQYTRRKSLFILVSAVTFGLIHWSGGLHQIILTSAIGAVFMIIYLHIRSLPAVIVAHFIVNFILFSNAIPLSLFSFFPVPPPP